VLSRDNKPRAGAQAVASAPADRAANTVLTLPTAADQGQAPVQVSRRALKNWRVRSRLLLLITIPTLTAVVLGGVFIVNSFQSAIAYQRVEQLANLSSAVTQLAGELGNERNSTVQYIADGATGRGGTASASAANLQLVNLAQGLSNPWTAKVRQELMALGAGYPAQVQSDAQNILARLSDLPALRAAALRTDLPATDVVNGYNVLIAQLLVIDDDVAAGSSDQTLATDVRALSLVSRVTEETSEQAALLTYAYTVGNFPANVLPALNAAAAEQSADFAQFKVAASPQQVTLYNSTVSGSLVDDANEYEATAIDFGEAGKKLQITPNTANEVAGAFSQGPLATQATVDQRIVAETIDRASALRKDAIILASAVGGGVLVVLLVALLLTTIVGRSMVRPLRRLRSGALEVAGVRLPETVRRMSDSDGAGLPLDVEPIDVDSADEIGEVARAFDQVHREALRLAANEAALRGNVNAMFVNLSRRSQSLVERQIRLIDDLEQGEQDSDRLSSLFQMDHLATRMRRNSENLLVLAGHDATRRWNQPVALVDVLRAAVSEIEQYERVTLNVQPGIAVRGHAVNDVVHLLAELAENATSFSSAETPVVVAGHLLSSGGVLLDITDQGVGMGAEEMAHANWRLDNPPVVDVAVSRRMGLFVVARLAARHGIRVRLRPASAGGLTALVWLPDEVVSHEAETVGGPPGLRRFDSAAVVAGLPGSGTVDDMLSATEQEINAARAPKFASLQADPSSQAEPEGNGKLAARRVPGAGPRPGASAWGTAATGPQPAFRSSPQAGPQSGAEFPPDTPFRHDDEAVASAADMAAATAYPSAEPFGTAPLPVVDLNPPTVQLSPAPQSESTPTLAASVTGTSRPDHGTFGRDASANGDVVIPPAEHVATQNRLPIFEAVESDWFRRGRSGLGGWPGPQEPAASAGSGSGAAVAAPEVPEVAWATPSDQGWEAAAAVNSPTTGGTTPAGLPKRVPQANLVPGAASPEAIAPVPVRSASATRDRLTSFQRGSREGRAAAGSEDTEDSGQDLEGSSR
jgi:signal transduction histidine kinase